ncbi:MAG: hypothetical protein H8D56_12880 [Planctomycetes bacterium]|nr:hypothetical protein [Planctomycetota bacterium]
MNIISLAFDLSKTVEVFISHARRYFYEVMLSGYLCPQCGGNITMTAESRCQCKSCHYNFDPTIAFQRCVACEGKPTLKICRYQCTGCEQIIQSRFVFEGNIFDNEYFKERMRQSRERQKQNNQLAIESLIENRSESLVPGYADLDAIPGLADALDGLSMGPEIAALLPLCKGFDLNRYQTHLQEHIGPIEVCFDDIPPLEENERLDRIWRFVAVIFMAHAGLIEICQEGQTIKLAKKDETN